MNKADLFLYVKWPHRQSPVLGLFFACLLYRLSFVKLLESFECNRSVVLISNGATLRRCGRCSRRDRNLPALTRLQTFWDALASIFTFTSLEPKTSRSCLFLKFPQRFQPIHQKSHTNNKQFGQFYLPCYSTFKWANTSRLPCYAFYTCIQISWVGRSTGQTHAIRLVSETYIWEGEFFW